MKIDFVSMRTKFKSISDHFSCSDVHLCTSESPNENLNSSLDVIKPGTSRQVDQMEPRRWKQLKLATAGGGTACLSRERAVIQTSFSLFERGDMVQIALAPYPIATW